MQEYLQILLLIAPVFGLLAVGLALRWGKILEPAAEKGIINVVVKALYPCLVVKSMIRADSFAEAPDSLWAPVMGVVTISIGFFVALFIGKAIGMKKGAGLRTFAFSAGIFNYGYIPIPLVQSMFSPNELAVLFVHNVGVEIAIWTVGVSMLAGASWKDGLKKIANPMVFALIIGLLLNLTGAGQHLPAALDRLLDLLSGCAVPMGLLVIGANLYEYLDTEEKIWKVRDCLGGAVLRLGLLPLVGLALAWALPLSIELKRVLVLQAAMPAGIMPIVLAKHYEGQPIVAVRVVFASTILGILTMPLWIRFGLSLVGG